MLTLKLLGLSLVFLGCVGMGNAMARGLYMELHIAEQLLALLRRVGSEVRCYKRPLPEIYRNFRSDLPQDFMEKLIDGSPKDAFALLPYDFAEGICLPFFEQVGHCSSEECDRLEQECSAEMVRMMEEKKETVKSKTKVYRSLGMAGGAAAVIMLL